MVRYKKNTEGEVKMNEQIVKDLPNNVEEDDSELSEKKTKKKI